MSSALAEAIRKFPRYEAAVREERQRIDDLAGTPTNGTPVHLVAIDDSGHESP